MDRVDRCPSYPYPEALAALRRCHLGVRGGLPVSGTIALSGTPGTGKSSVARALAGRVSSCEVGDLALRLGCGTGGGRKVQVDMSGLRRKMVRLPRSQRPDMVVGHLSHLLPLRDTIILRCHPLELDRRLRRARRGSSSERAENVTAEATDLILVEAIERRRRIWEVDTTARPLTDVTDEVWSLCRLRPSARYGSLQWLTDPAVTENLLRPTR